MKVYWRYTSIALIFLIACKGEAPKAPESSDVSTEISIDSTQIQEDKTASNAAEAFVLTEENVIPFFNDYAQDLKVNKVRISTKFGTIDIELFKETPYHWANFMYLTRKGYYNDTYFHRSVPKFVIQGGNSDKMSTAYLRRDIGKYLLPPDTRKGFKHHRGIVSMPSSDDVSNPHKLASPYEFFIVTQSPGAYHLDGKYTAFGRVIRGMDVVDKINAIPTDKGEWPLENVQMTVEILE